MIKRLLVIALLYAIGSAQSFSQCIPDTTIQTVGVFPDSATGLAIGTQFVAYNQVLQIKAPLDTQVTIVIFGIPTNINVTIDSMHLNAINGLPNGLSLTCSTPTCTFAGGANGCADISGIPTDTGTFPLTAIVTSYAHPAGLPYSQTDSIQYYTIRINGTTGLNDIQSNTFTVQQNNPNPFNGKSIISYHLPYKGAVTFKLFNLLGKQVYNSTQIADGGKNIITINASDFDAGIYVYSIQFDTKTITKRLVIANR